MIYKIDLQQALQAAGENPTTEELDNQYEQLQSAWENLRNQYSEQAKQGYKNQHGVWPDGMTFGQILNQADQLAWDQIQQDWIQPYTDQAAELAAEMEDDRTPHQKVIDNPETWPTAWPEMYPSDEALTISVEVWPNPTQPYRGAVAASLIQLKMELGQPYPISPEDTKLIQEFEQQIDQAVILETTRH